MTETASTAIAPIAFSQSKIPQYYGPMAFGFPLGSKFMMHRMDLVAPVSSTGKLRDSHGRLIAARVDIKERCKAVWPSNRIRFIHLPLQDDCTWLLTLARNTNRRELEIPPVEILIQLRRVLLDLGFDEHVRPGWFSLERN